LRSEGGGEAIAKAIKHATERSIEISKTIEKTAAL
ncbi:pyrroline-5-carboxylate reductase, partial [Salinicoccus roseus]